MTIEWYGASCVKITTGESTVVVDPFGPSSGLKVPRLSADMALLTGPSADAGAVSGKPFIVKGPGEYEVKKTFVYGIPVTQEKQHDPLTIYLIEAEGISCAHLGMLGQKLVNGEMERLEGVDILFVPVGGHGVLNADQASEVISELEPRIVVPMCYKIPGFKQSYEGVQAFAKEMGVKESETTDKLKVAAKDLPQDNMRIVILTP